VTRSLRAYAGSVRAVLVVLVACVVSGALAGTVFAATADESYAYRSDVGSGGAMPFQTPSNSVAVSSADDRLFIGREFDGNFGSGAFEVLDASGTSITQVPSSTFTTGIAVSPDGSSVYTLGFFQNPIKLTSDGAPTPTYTQDPLWNPSVLSPNDIAVDPSTGDVLLASGNSVVRVDSSTGAQLSTVTGSVSPSRIATAPNGDIYLLDNLGGRIEHLASDGTSKGRLAIPTAAAAWTNPGIAVNPQNGDVAVELPAGYVTANDAVVRIYTAANVLKDTFRVPAAVASGHAGLAFSADGTKLYVGLADGTAHVFELGIRPGIDTPSVSQIGTTSFHVSSEVATAGQATTAQVEYCLASDPCTQFLTADAPSPWHALTPHTGLSNPTDDDPIDDDVTGLEPNTDYLVRVYAIGDISRVENSTAAVAVRTALVPPTVQTGAANADDHSAELTGTINTRGGQTTYHFEYGLTTNYGSNAPAGPEAIAGNLRTTRTVTRTIKSLQPGTTYHYRLVATNPAGTAAGADRTFTTLGVDQVAPRRGYEQVTSPDKKGLSLNGNWGFYASPDGGAIEYTAAEPASDSSSAALSARYIARRGGTDWIGQQPLDPPLTPGRAIIGSVTHAVSDDSEHAMVVTPVALTADAVQGAANIYVTDVDTGAYHLVGTATQPGAYSGMDGTKHADVFIGGARDFSWIVLISRFPLLPNAPQVAMYKWSKTDGLSIISRLPGNAIPTGKTWSQTYELTTNRLVSDDGNTVAFTLLNGDDGVYRRSGGQTVAISASPVSGGVVKPGLAVGMSRDGRYVVFLSHSKLTDDATDLVVPMNVYRYDAQTGGLTLLGESDGIGDGSNDVIAISDDGNTVYYNGFAQTTDANNNPVTVDGLTVWRNGQVHPVGDSVTYGYASPNGRYLVVFQGGANVVYLYDADARDLTCISCTLDGDGRGGQLPDPERNINNSHPRAVTDDGHAYFGTTQALLNVDHNQTNDVYEYYRGRVTLLSPGDRDFDALLVDISPDGSDVFFTTAEGLVGQDTDQAYDVYDARLGGGLAAQNPPAPNAPCAKSECAEPGLGPVTSPSVGSPPEPSGKPAKRTNQAKVKLSLGRVSIGSKTMKITFHASQRGRVTVSGARIIKAYKNVTKEGTYNLSVRLSKKARSLLHAKKKFKLAVKVSLAGGWGTSSAKYSRTLNK